MRTRLPGLIRLLAITALYSSVAARLRFPTRLAGRLNGAALQPFGKLLAALLFMLIIPAKLVGGTFSSLMILCGALSAVSATRRADYATATAGALAALLSGHTLAKLRTARLDFRRSLGITSAASSYSLQAQTPITHPQKANTLPGKLRCQRDIIYGTSPVTGQPLRGNLWQPPVSVSASGIALLYFHASAWQALDYGLTMQPLLRRLAEQGHLVMDVGYTLAPQADMQNMLDEVRLAVAWMNAHAEQLGADLQRIVLMGSSGGGHLALLAAYVGDLNVAGVIACYAPTDMYLHFEEYGRMEPRQPRSSDQITAAMHANIHDKTWLDRWFTRVHIWPAYRYQNLPGGALLLVNLLGGTPGEAPEAYRWASPLFHPHRDCPPTLQIFGAHDFYFSPEHGRRLHRALQDCGAVSYYLELPYAEHGFDTIAWQISPAAQVAANAIQEFLVSITMKGRPVQGPMGW